VACINTIGHDGFMFIVDWLISAMQHQQQAKKRSRVEAFLAEEAVQTKTSKSHTRLELARVRNKKEQDYQKMMKTQAVNTRHACRWMEMKASGFGEAADQATALPEIGIITIQRMEWRNSSNVMFMTFWIQSKSCDISQK